MPTKYHCKNCDRSFHSLGTIECEFCGMENLQEEKDASDLLDEVW